MLETLNLPSPHQIRQELQGLVLQDLHGPAGGEEEIIDEQYVRDRYILGKLAPKGQSALSDVDEDLALTGENTQEAPSEPASLRNFRYHTI